LEGVVIVCVNVADIEAMRKAVEKLGCSWSIMPSDELQPLLEVTVEAFS